MTHIMLLTHKTPQFVLLYIFVV